MRLALFALLICGCAANGKNFTDRCSGFWDFVCCGPRIQAFQQRLGELGYVEGKNIIIEQRYAEGKILIVPDLTGELIRLKPDVIVTDTSRAIQVAKNATKTIPIVFTSANDLVGDRQVASLARPGGNLTGFSLLAPELNWKRLELLKDGFPKITRIGFSREPTQL